jgi:hypothetical protein
MTGISEPRGMWTFLRKLNFGLKGLHEEKLCIPSGAPTLVFHGTWDWQITVSTALARSPEQTKCVLYQKPLPWKKRFKG